MNRRWTSRWTGPASALVLTAVAVLTLWTAYGYNRPSGIFPVFIGWIFVVLALAETVLQLRRLAAGGGRAAAGTDPAPLLREATGVAWLAGFLLAVYLAGFLVATTLFLAAYLRITGGRPLVSAAAIGLIATGIVYGVFGVLLEYRLYPGLLFGA